MKKKTGTLISVVLTMMLVFNLASCGIGDSESYENDLQNYAENNVIEDVIEEDIIVYNDSIPNDVIVDNISYNEGIYECVINDNIICDSIVINTTVTDDTTDEIEAQLPEEYKDYDIEWPKVIGKFAAGTSIIIVVGIVEYFGMQAVYFFGTPTTIARDAVIGGVAGIAINTSIECAIDGKPTKEKLKKYAIEGFADGYMWGAIASVTKNVVKKQKLRFGNKDVAKIQKNGDVIGENGNIIGKAFYKGDKIYLANKNGKVKNIFSSNGKELFNIPKRLPANSVFQFNSAENYYTDSKGVIYRIGNDLCKSTTYYLNGYKYKTDSKGRTVLAIAENLKRDNNPRLTITDSMETIAHNSQKTGDQRFHIIGDMFGGDNSMANLVPVKGSINQGAYKEMEMLWKQALENGQHVNVEVKLVYSNSFRPDKLIVHYCIDKGSVVDKVFQN